MRAAPSAPVSDAALRLGPSDAFEPVTQFRRAWGAPPPVPGVSWNAMRAIYEPDPGTQGRGGAQAAALERRAADDVFMQAYRSGEAGEPWRFRWVRVPTAIPTAGAPYTVLGEVEALDARPLAATQPAASLEDLQRRIQFNDTLTERAAQRASTFDITLYQFVGVRHTKGQVDRMVYHLEPRKDLPPQQQEELWEALCTSPDVPPQFRSSAEDCQVRRWFREANAKIK